jgi:integrase
MGREDVYHAINFSEKFGARIEGVMLNQVNHLKEALTTGELYLREKGGLERYVPVKTEEQVNTIKNLLSYAQKNGKNGTDKTISADGKHGVKEKIKSIQNWVTNNRDKFQDNSIRSRENIQELKKTAENSGLKMRTENLSFHGLRYKYAQDRYQTLKNQGFSDKMAKATVSRELGHFREDITNVYLARK